MPQEACAASQLAGEEGRVNFERRMFGRWAESTALDAESAERPQRACCEMEILSKLATDDVRKERRRAQA
jgi:hypothetical protein